MAELTWDDYDEPDQDDDDGWRDDDPDDDWYGGEPDDDDYELLREYEELYEHQEKVHGGGVCDCRPSLLDRLKWAGQRVVRWVNWVRWTPARIAITLNSPRTVSIGRLEFTIRLRRPRDCMACGGKGWFYTKGTMNPMPMPEGYDGVAVCGCGSAIAKLAETRAVIRKMRTEPPF